MGGAGGDVGCGECGDRVEGGPQDRGEELGVDGTQRGVVSYGCVGVEHSLLSDTRGEGSSVRTVHVASVVAGCVFVADVVCIARVLVVQVRFDTLRG